MRLSSHISSSPSPKCGTPSKYLNDDKDRKKMFHNQNVRTERDVVCGNIFPVKNVADSTFDEMRTSPEP